MDDERFYARVVAELRASGPLPGLWAKAFAESNGDESVARALYFRLRVAQLQAVEEELQEAVRKSKQQSDAPRPEHDVLPKDDDTAAVNPAYLVFIVIAVTMLASALIGYLAK